VETVGLVPSLAGSRTAATSGRQGELPEAVSPGDRDGDLRGRQVGPCPLTFGATWMSIPAAGTVGQSRA
jgi:hypothetical protein